MILVDGNDILVTEPWLSKLVQQKAELQSRLYKLLQKTDCSSYLELDRKDLDQVLDRHFSMILSSLETGSVKELREEAGRRAEVRAQDPQFQLRHLVGFFLLTRQSFREAVTKLVRPEERMEAMTKIGGVLDTATLVAADAFAASRQALIVRQQAELADMAAIVRDEIDTLNRSIAKSATSIESLNNEVRELREYREALVDKMMTIGRKSAP